MTEISYLSWEFERDVKLAELPNSDMAGNGLMATHGNAFTCINFAVSSEESLKVYQLGYFHHWSQVHESTHRREFTFISRLSIGDLSLTLQLFTDDIS